MILYEFSEENVNNSAVVKSKSDSAVGRNKRESDEVSCTLVFNLNMVISVCVKYKVQLNPKS